MKFKVPTLSLIKLYSVTFRDYLLHSPLLPSSEKPTNIGKNDIAREKTEKKEKKIKKVEMSESRIRKFHKLFNKTIPDDEKLIDYFSCALIADILLQGYLYVSENYFSFYSNVFGYITKLVIPISSVTLLTKEKTAKMFSNAIGVQVDNTKHAFGSFISREVAFQLMQGMVKKTHMTSTLGIDDEKEEDTMDFIEVNEEGITESSKEDSSSLSSDSPTQYQIPEISLISSTPEEEVKPIQHYEKEEIIEIEVESKPSSTLIIIGIALTLILAFFSAFLLIRINSIENRKFINNPMHKDYSQMSIDEAEDVLNKNIMTVVNVRKKLEELQKVLEKSFNGGSSREEL